MDVPAADVPGIPQSDAVVGDKRPNNENGDGGEEMVAPPAKKPRFGEEMKRVAEIVLVLSAMGRIRGGNTPTESELDLMAEARSKLADMCQEFTPKDIIGREAIGAVIEDLGLNGKLKDQRLGFRAPNLTISEKLSLSKRKMEESKKYSAPSTGYTSHLSQPSGVAGASGLSTLGSATHTVRSLPSDRANHQAVSSGVFPASSPYVAMAGNASMAHQWPNNEIKASTASATAVGSHYIRDASGLGQSRMERPQITSASQGPAISSVNYSIGNAPTWAAQPQSNSTANSKVPVQSSVRASDHSFRPFMSPTTPGTFAGTNQLMQGMSYGQASPFGNNHAEITKIVQKFLQPRVHQNPTWNPPSREYMNKAMTCQLCQATISEVETVLICDACDKGYHLKCLQANNLKGVPKSEWHCSRCVQLYNGKPFPPKYGRVMRSPNTPKVPSSAAGAQKGKMPDLKVNQQKTTVTANPALQSSGIDSERSKPPATLPHSETAGLNTNTAARAATNASLGSNAETANAAASATSKAMTKNGPVSEGPRPVGTKGSTPEAPLANCVPTNANSNAISSAAGGISLGAQGPPVVGSSSLAAWTGNETANTVMDVSSPAPLTSNETASTVMDASLSTQCHKVVDTSCSDSQMAVSRSEDATFSAMENASCETQGPAGNVATCSNSSELISDSETLKAKRASENGQELSKEDASERTASVTYEDNPTRSMDTPEKDAKITAKSSVGQENSICQTEDPVSQQPILPSNSISNSDHCLPENKTSNVRSALQNDADHPQDEKSVGILDARNCDGPSDQEDKLNRMKETAGEVKSIP